MEIRSTLRSLALTGSALFLLAAAGCQSSSQAPMPPPSAPGAAAATFPSGAAPIANEPGLVLHEGDSVAIRFPSAPDLDTTQTIRRDGKITLNMVGDIQAAGLSTTNLQAAILKLYASQLRDNQVDVSVNSSAFQVWVTGAVTHPGRISSERQLTVLEAMIEAGIDFDRANLGSVTVLRTLENGKTKKFRVDVSKTLRHASADNFNLEPYDIIYVRERFQWY